jgi:hypothetical protein
VARQLCRSNGLFWTGYDWRIGQQLKSADRQRQVRELAERGYLADASFADEMMTIIRSNELPTLDFLETRVQELLSADRPSGALSRKIFTS